MTENEQRVARLQKQLGHKPLNRTWAKLEIVFGLLAVGVSLWLLTFPFAPGAYGSELIPALMVGGVVLFALGGYLAMAGHRSHLYQSPNELTAYLAELIQNPNAKGSRDEHSR